MSVLSNFELISRISQRHPPIITLLNNELGGKRLLNKQHADLKYTDVVVNPLLLVLRYALGNPSDVPNFLDQR